MNASAMPRVREVSKEYAPGGPIGRRDQEIVRLMWLKPSAANEFDLAHAATKAIAAVTTAVATSSLREPAHQSLASSKAQYSDLKTDTLTFVLVRKRIAAACLTRLIAAGVPDSLRSISVLVI